MLLTWSLNSKDMANDEKKIVGVSWFTSTKGTVGVAKVIDPLEGICYFISAVDGFNEEDDKEFIADWGARFPNDAGDKLFTQGWY